MNYTINWDGFYCYVELRGDLSYDEFSEGLVKLYVEAAPRQMQGLLVDTTHLNSIPANSEILPVGLDVGNALYMERTSGIEQNLRYAFVIVSESIKEYVLSCKSKVDQSNAPLEYRIFDNREDAESWMRSADD